MKTLWISPRCIKIIEEAIDFVVTGDWKMRVLGYLNQYKEHYLITDKSVIAVKDNVGDLIALDGNKLCFCARLVNKEVQCMILERESDKEALDRKKYNSQLIWGHTLQEIIQKDYFDCFYRCTHCYSWGQSGSKIG